jgi:hypothetical protein
MEENANHHHKTVASLDSALSAVVMASFKRRKTTVNCADRRRKLDSLSSKNDAIRAYFAGTAPLDSFGGLRAA